MISIPRGYGFRSGIGATVEDGTQDDWTGVSPNGRQYRSAITGQINDLQGSNYWHMRKELPDRLSTASEIAWNTYPIPSYYHKVDRSKQGNVAQENEGFGGNLEHNTYHNSEVDTETVNTKMVDTEMVDTEEEVVYSSPQQDKESVFLSLSEDNVFRKLYMKLTRKEKQK